MTETNCPSCKERILGSLLGGAIGDALGAPVEFLSLAQIRETFGADGLQGYAPAYGRLGAITDDTQMTLFTAEGLLRAYVRANTRGVASVPSVISHAYLRWLWTQGIESRVNPDSMEKQGWLWTVEELHSQRAPGRTCISALQGLKSFTSQRANNDSKGAGGIMRVGPVAMMFAQQADKADKVFDLAQEAAWLTHGHPSGFLSAGAFAVILHAILCGDTLRVGIGRAREFLLQECDHIETLLALDRAVELADTQVDPDVALPKLGEAWVGEEALGVATYCTLMASCFRDGVLMAVNHDGDSDTTGSLAGQLLGASYGVGSLPEEWLTSLELRETIEQIGRDLSEHRSWKLDYMSDDYDSSVEERYPGF